MTIPTQRTDDEPGPVMRIVLDTLRRVEDSVDRLSQDVNTQLSRLPEMYATRRETERWRDDLTKVLTAAEAKHDADIARIDNNFEKARLERVSARRWLFGTGLTAVGAAAGVITGIVGHFH
jgi:hypothetical protein